MLTQQEPTSSFVPACMQQVMLVHTKGAHCCSGRFGFGGRRLFRPGKLLSGLSARLCGEILDLCLSKDDVCVGSWTLEHVWLLDDEEDLHNAAIVSSQRLSKPGCNCGKYLRSCSS